MRFLEEQHKLALHSKRGDPLAIRPEDDHSALVIGGIPYHVVMFKA
jgi:hypothetical protein